MMPEAVGAGAPPARTIQDRALAYWERTGVVARALEVPSTGAEFRFTEGPPTANGPPHLGHLVARVMKDLQLRYHRMRGDRVISMMAGWDCHGLPVELALEKRHGLKSKKEIEAYGVDRFCDECRGSTLAVADVWRDMSRQLGYWLDYDHAYRTMDAPYIESVWWSLKTLFDRGLLEKGHYVLPYCPRCETPLATHEVAQGHREATDPSVTVRFPLTDAARPRDLLVWTTTPWTLPANLLVAARADLEYSVVEDADGSELVLASSAVPRYFPDGVTVRERLRGRDLAGRLYRPPFDTGGPGAGRYRVVLDDFVTAEDGTGLVHVAPSFGPDDQRVGAREKVGVFDPLDSRGVFTAQVPLVQGKFFKTADPILLKDLASRGLLYRSTTLRHVYPFCWRCDTALLYRAIDSWFVRTSRFTDALVQNNAGVRWVPAYLRDGRFGNFLTEAKLWVCPQGHTTCVGSFAELARYNEAPLPEPFDPHRAQADAISFPCPHCRKLTRREPYTIDVWYDSGAAPFAQFHHPFEPSPFDPKRPLDYVAEGLDQTRGWFYTMLVLSTALFGRAAYTASLTTGMVLDESGRKMSKSKGNVLEPIPLLERVGADPVRWTFLTLDFTEPMRLGEPTIQKAAGRTLGTLANLVVFHRENAHADHLPAALHRPSVPSALDRWALSRLEGTRTAVTAALDSFDPRPAAIAVRELVDDLSTWYVRRSRPRFWGTTSAEDRRAAHDTLSYALLGLARLSAPLLPFTAEWVHQEVGEFQFAARDSSVHLQRWPTELGTRDVALESGMAELRALVEVGRELRQRAEVKARIPLAEFVLFGTPSPEFAALGAEGEQLLLDEMNVKSLRWVGGEDRAAFPEDAWVVRVERDRPVAALPRAPTPELRSEGLYREVARRLQQSRKDLGLRPTDHVDLTLAAAGELLAAVTERRAALARDLLADHIELVDGTLPAAEDVRPWDLDGLAFTARLVRAPP
jgi:isoleucyl-tRNA synthetase